MKIVYLPIDSRPCNMDFPPQLLACAGASCVTPPLDAMDHFTRPADGEAIRAFLAREAKDADALILSVDQLAFGSLLASREDGVPEAEALRRVQGIAALKAANPRLRVAALSVVMRSSISTLRREDVAHHHAMTAYSQAYHRAKISGSPDDLAEAQRIAASLPAELLAKYRRVRDRNHTVNRACIRLAQEGVIDRLLLLQEDSQPLGFHKLEQAALLDEIAASGAMDRIALHNGTDEGGCLCAAMLAAKPLNLHVRELGGGTCDFIAKYEDRSFAQNIASHCRFAGITLTGLGEADKVLAVLTPGGAPQRDALDPEAETPRERERFERLADELAALSGYGKPVGLLDVCYANGGADSFLRALATRVDPLTLAAYSAWNTASNALGTALAQLALGEKAGENRIFTAERLLDDLLYQGVVRAELQAELAALGEDPYHLTDKPRAQQRLAERMNAAVQAHPALAGYEIRAEYSLPWPRTFEAAVAVRSLNKTKEEGAGHA